MGNEMYFIVKGICEVIINDPGEGAEPNIVSTKVRGPSQLISSSHFQYAGDYFGEVALLTSLRRTAWVRTRTFCTLASLCRKDFDIIMGEAPHVRQIVVKTKIILSAKGKNASADSKRYED